MPEKDNRERGTEKFREHGWRKASTAVLLTRLLILVVLMVGAFVLAHGCSLFTNLHRTKRPQIILDRAYCASLDAFTEPSNCFAMASNLASVPSSAA